MFDIELSSKVIECICLFCYIIVWNTSMAKWSACLITNHEVEAAWWVQLINYFATWLKSSAYE